MSSIFDGAKYGDRFLTRNEGIAYYGRYDEKEGKHFLMVSDFENDWVLCHSDGHVFHVEEFDKCTFKGKNEGKTYYEVYGCNRDEMKEFRLDIVSRAD